MVTNPSRWAACAAFALAACAPVSYRDQVKHVEKHDDYRGHLAGDLSPVSGKETAFGGHSGEPVRFERFSGSEVCVTRRANPQWFKGIDTIEEVLAGFEKAGKTRQMKFVAFDSLAELAQASEFPAMTSATTFQITSHEVEEHPFDHDDGRVTYTYVVLMTLEWCSPAPPIKATTRYLALLALTAKPPDVYVWDLDEPPAADVFVNAAGPTSPEAGTTSPGAASPEAKVPATVAATRPEIEDRPATEALGFALDHSRRFSKFVGIAEAAGMRSALASGGPFTLIVPVDSAIALQGADLAKLHRDKARCRRIFKRYVAKGLVAAASVAAQKEVSVPMLDGTVVQLRSDASGLSAGDVPLAPSVVNATNGVVYEATTGELPQ